MFERCSYFVFIPPFFTKVKASCFTKLKTRTSIVNCIRPGHLISYVIESLLKQVVLLKLQNFSSDFETTTPFHKSISICKATFPIKLFKLLTLSFNLKYTLVHFPFSLLCLITKRVIKYTKHWECQLFSFLWKRCLNCTKNLKLILNNVHYFCNISDVFSWFCLINKS